MNSLPVSVTLWYKNGSSSLVELTTLEPGMSYNLPLPVVYGKHDGLYVKPAVDG